MLLSRKNAFSACLIPASCATPFLDGYSTASAAFLISLIPGFGSVEIALFTSLFLIGSFLGAATAGSIADHVGRRPLYLSLIGTVAVVVTFVALCPSVALLLIMRLVTGLAIGGDYPVSQAMVSEQTDESKRARALTFLMLAWYFGALAAVCASIPVTNNDLPWQCLLWLQAGVAALAFVLRLGIPESQDWINRQSRTTGFAPKMSISRLYQGFVEVAKVARTHRGAVIFCAGFWLCQTIPATIMMLYSPKILFDICGSTDAIVQMFILYGFFLVGIVPASCSFFTARPKRILCLTFLAMAAGLLGVMLFAEKSLWLTNVSFVIFAVSYGLQSPLDFVYPNRLFATEVRGTLVGIVTSVSRIGAAAAAFIFPVLEPVFQIHLLMMCGVLVLLLGFVLATKWAPADR